MTEHNEVDHRIKALQSSYWQVRRNAVWELGILGESWRYRQMLRTSKYHWKESKTT